MHISGAGYLRPLDCAAYRCACMRINPMTGPCVRPEQSGISSADETSCCPPVACSRHAVQVHHIPKLHCAPCLPGIHCKILHSPPLEGAFEAMMHIHKKPRRFGQANNIYMQATNVPFMCAIEKSLYEYLECRSARQLVAEQERQEQPASPCRHRLQARPGLP